MLIDSSKIHKGVTLFPFFDRDGVIHKIMIIVPPAGVYYLDSDTGKLRIDWLGRARLSGHISDLPRMRSSAAFIRLVVGERVRIQFLHAPRALSHSR